jgi:hypothetical protein
MTKLTKTETRLIDREILIHEPSLDRAIFYNLLSRIVTHWRCEELHDNDAYEQYLDTLINDNLYL